MIYAFLAPGFEEIEAITPIDMLRRCKKEVITVGIGDTIIKGAHNIQIVTDTEDKFITFEKDLEMIILPGGMPGTINLEKSEMVQKAIDYCMENNIYIAAICAAPSILGHRNYLAGKKATCYVGFETQLTNAEVTGEPVVVDGNIITARGAGVSLEFGSKLVEILISKERSDLLGDSLLCMKN